MVPVAYSVALVLGLWANLTALALLNSGRHLGQVSLLNLALAHMFFMLTLSLWLT